jgi:hypothetical protein
MSEVKSVAVSVGSPNVPILRAALPWASMWLRETY